jgi:hypothetical protein
MERWAECSKSALVLMVGASLLLSGCTGGGGESTQDGGSDVGSEVASPEVSADFTGLDGRSEQLSPNETRSEVALLTLPVGLMVPPDLGVKGDVASLRVLSGHLPAGVFIDGSGQAWGRPTRDENVAVTLEVSAADGSKTEQDWAIETRRGAFAILPPEEVVGAVGSSFLVQMELAASTDGQANWKISRGALPPGLELDEITGVIAGTPTVEGFFPAIIEATVEDNVAQLAILLRIGGESLLTGMAEVFEANALDHLSPNGMLVSSWPDGHFGDHGDSGMWTGTFLAAMAFKTALTGDDTALRHIAEGLTTCRMVTGIPGLTARGIEKDEWKGRTELPNITVDHPEGHQSTTPGYEDYRWQGDVSRDQWTGHFLGNSLTYRLALDEETRAAAAENMIAMAKHLWEHDMEIHDVDGVVTKYGHMSGYVMDGGFPLPNGVNAIMSLAWFTGAAQAAVGTADEVLLAGAVSDMLSPPPADWNFMEDDGEIGYIEAMEEILYPYIGSYGDRQWFNMNISNDAFFNALLLLPDGPSRERIGDIWWEEMWVDHGDTPLTRRAESEKNPWFTFMFLGALARYDAEAHFEALEQMVRFPAPPRLAVAISNSDNPAYPHAPDWDQWALDALPTEERCSGTNFVWQRCPYELDCMGSVGQEYGGTDYLAPYWLGVAMGYIDFRL